MNIQENHSPIFIVGSPRSGTTLMRYCLNQHSNIFIPHETLFWAKVYGNRKLYPESRLSKHLTYLIGHLFYYGFSASTEYSEDDFNKVKEKILLKVQKEAKTYRDIACVVFSELAAMHGKKRWGEKTPGHVFYLNEIFELFPNAKIINMERNPKNIISSSLKSTHVSNNFLRATMRYKLSIQVAQKWKDSILTIEYEKLTKSPEKILRQVCDYIDEEFEPLMLTPGMQDSSYGEKSVVFDKKIGIKAENTDKWKSVLTPYQSDFIDFVINAPSKPKIKVNFLFNYLKLRIYEATFLASLYKNRLGYQDIRGLLSSLY